MTTMVTEVYDALRDAGASEEKSRKAAEAIANYDNRLAAIDTRLTVLTWMVGTNLVVTLGVLWRLLAH
jgi:hypothetical protein